MPLELVKQIAQKGLRIFTKKDITEIALSLGYRPNYVQKLNTLLIQKKYIEPLGKGLYTFPSEFLVGGPLHSFEIGIKIAKKGAISHRSALFYHELTDQILSTVYVTVPKEEGANRRGPKIYTLQGVTYHLTRISPKSYWGVKAVFLDQARVDITDLERTLIDGLTRPKLCGGFREVLYAFELAASRINPDLIFDYAKRTSLVACKRLGWVLEELKVFPEIQERLAALPMSYPQKLDASGKRSGKINKRWNLQENIYYDSTR